MRKYVFLLIIAFFAFSCSSSEDESTNNGNTNTVNLKKPKKISVFEGYYPGNGTPLGVYNFQYEGDKLIKITAENYEVNIEYGSNGLFSKITEITGNFKTVFSAALQCLA